MLTNTALDRLTAIWRTRNSPQLHSFEPFKLTQWLGELQVAKQDFQQEIRDNLLNLDEKGKLHYLDALRAQLDAAADIVAKLPIVTRCKLQQVLRSGKAFAHGAAYTQVVDSLAAQQHEETSPQRDEVVAKPFQNEAIQAAFVDVYLLIAQRPGAFSLETTSGPKSRARGKAKKVQSAFTWNAGPKDLLDLILTLEEKNHITRNELDVKKLSQFITSLFELSHADEETESADWVIFKPYFYDTTPQKNPDGSVTIVYNKRAKKSLYKEIKPYKD